MTGSLRSGLAVAGLLMGLCACSPAAGNGEGRLLSQTTADEIDLYEFMVHALDHSARDFWSGWEVISSESGDEERFPASPEEWKRVEDGAATVLLLTNVLATPDYRLEGADSWDGYVEVVADVARRARLAAANERADEMEDLGVELYEACSACHDAEWEE